MGGGSARGGVMDNWAEEDREVVSGMWGKVRGRGGGEGGA